MRINLKLMKKIIIFAVIILLLATIPLVVFFVQKNQEIRSRAVSATSVRFSPTSLTKSLTDAQFNVDIQISTGVNQINGASFTIPFPKNILEVVEINKNDSAFTDGGQINQNLIDLGNTSGSIKYFFYSSTGYIQSPTDGDSWITIATIKFKPKANGVGTISFTTDGSSTLTAVDVGTESTDNPVIGGNSGWNSTVSVTVGGQSSTNTPTPTTGASTNTPTPTTGITGTNTPTVSVTRTPTPTTSVTKTPTPTGSITRTPTPTGSPQSTGTPTPTTTSGTLAITNVTTDQTLTSKRPTFRGTSKPNSTITIVINSDPITGVVTANSSGSWTYTPDVDLDEGHHTISVTEQAPDGSTRTTSSSFYINTTGTPSTGTVSNTIMLIGTGLILVLMGLALL